MIKALTENVTLQFKSQDGYEASVRLNGTLALKSPRTGIDALGGVDNLRLIGCPGYNADKWKLIPRGRKR